MPFSEQALFEAAVAVVRELRSERGLPESEKAAVWPGMIGDVVAECGGSISPAAKASALATAERAIFDRYDTITVQSAVNRIAAEL